MTTVPYPGSATLTAALDGATIQSVTWSCSNANGSISGSGNTVSVANVNIGTCTVTAVITDTAGKTYTKTIDLTMQ